MDRPKPGSFWTYLCDNKETFDAECVEMNDVRMRGKLAHSGDICLYFKELNYCITYDFPEVMQYLTEKP